MLRLVDLHLTRNYILHDFITFLVFRIKIIKWNPYGEIPLSDRH